MATTVRSDEDAGEGHPVVAATPARQGRYGRPVFWVLVVSTLLAVIGLALAWGWRAPALHRADEKVSAQRVQAAATTDTPPAPVKQAP